MSRSLIFGSAAIIGLALLASGPAEAQKAKKKSGDTSVVSGKIDSVNLNAETKKVESIYVVIPMGKRTFNKGVRLDDKTKIEWGDIAKEDQILKEGQQVEAKLRPESDVADLLKVSAGATKKKK